MRPSLFRRSCFQVNFRGVDFHVHETSPFPSAGEPLIEADITPFPAGGFSESTAGIGVQGMGTDLPEIAGGAGEYGSAGCLLSYQMEVLKKIKRSTYAG